MTQNLTDRVATEVRAEMGRQRASQRRVAEILRISQPQVSQRLRGVVAFNTEELGLLAAAWGVPASRFLLDAESIAAAS